MEFYNGERLSCSQGKPNITRSNLIALLVALAMTGCAIQPQVVTVEEDQQRVMQDLVLQQQDQGVVHAISLAEATTRTLRSNLNFGVSYFRVQQVADIVLIQEEQKRKATNRIEQHRPSLSNPRNLLAYKPTSHA